MIYGLYLSATGVLTNSYRQDVIANNLANSETVGFKRDLAMFRERPTAAQERGLSGTRSNRLLESLGGGTFAMPTYVDQSQGEIEPTGKNLDVAIVGDGYFSVDDHGNQRLTRDGGFMMDRDGYLVMANGQGQRVLDAQSKPIKLDPLLAGTTLVDKEGAITQGGKPVAQLGFFDVADRSKLTKVGGTMLLPTDAGAFKPATGVLQSGFLERSNVDPANELVQLMEAQRLLEANANMIRYQDQTLSRLVTDVGKIG